MRKYQTESSQRREVWRTLWLLWLSVIMLPRLSMRTGAKRSTRLLVPMRSLLSKWPRNTIFQSKIGLRPQWSWRFPVERLSNTRSSILFLSKAKPRGWESSWRTKRQTNIAFIWRERMQLWRNLCHLGKKSLSLRKSAEIFRWVDCELWSLPERYWQSSSTINGPVSMRKLTTNWKSTKKWSTDWWMSSSMEFLSLESQALKTSYRITWNQRLRVWEVGASRFGWSPVIRWKQLSVLAVLVGSRKQLS